MRYATRAVALVLAIMALSGARPNGRSDESALRELEQRWLASEDNPVALESILADDFIHALPSGLITKREQLDYMRAQKPRPRPARHFEQLRVRIYGDVGITNGIVAAARPDGSVQKTVFTDVFVRREGRWQAVNAQENP